MANGIPADTRLPHRQVRMASLAISIVLCVYWVVLFYGTHMTLAPGTLPGNSDKYIHCTSYGVLGVLLMSLRANRGAFPWTSAFGRWLCLAAYGAFDEWTQTFVNRTADFHDWCADVIGAAFGIGFVAFASWLIRCRSK